MRKLFYILIFCILVMILNTGCSILQKIGIIGDNDELRPVSSVILGEDEAAKIIDKNPIRLYFANEDNTKLRAEIRYIKLTNVGKNTGNLATTIVKELIKGPGKGTGLKATIPEDAKLKTPVIIEGRTAIVDFSREFIENHTGEKDAEKLTIYSVVNSLTELEGIEKVKFKIEGKSKAEFKGGFKFDAPFPRSTSIISKEPPVRGEIESDMDTDADEDKDAIIEDKNNETDSVNLKKREDSKTNEEKSKETFDEYDEEEILE
jgi:germination protein M